GPQRQAAAGAAEAAHLDRLQDAVGREGEERRARLAGHDGKSYHPGTPGLTPPSPTLYSPGHGTPRRARGAGDGGRPRVRSRGRRPRGELQRQRGGGEGGRRRGRGGGPTRGGGAGRRRA